MNKNDRIMSETDTVHLSVFVTNHVTRWESSRIKTHVTADDGRLLCGRNLHGTETCAADWEWLHQPDYYDEVCQTCRKKAIALLRPKATYWFLSPFNGDRHEYATLRKAMQAASKEHGTVTIFQLGPGDTNKIAKIRQGLNALP